MWLLKNGDQVAIRTFDGVMHKLNIVHNTEYEIIPTKQKDLIFVMTNCGRDFKICNKDAKYIDYDLVDRIIHSVPIDTERFAALYHNLIYKQ
jgi:protein associated with RNAse G/E